MEQETLEMLLTAQVVASARLIRADSFRPPRNDQISKARESMTLEVHPMQIMSWPEAIAAAVAEIREQRPDVMRLLRQA